MFIVKLVDSIRRILFFLSRYIDLHFLSPKFESLHVESHIILYHTKRQDMCLKIEAAGCSVRFKDYEGHTYIDRFPTQAQ